MTRAPESLLRGIRGDHDVFSVGRMTSSVNTMTTSSAVPEAAQRGSWLARASLVLGIVGLTPLLLPPIGSLVAIVCGVSAPRISSAEGRMRRPTEARVGILLGVVGLTLGVLAVFVYFIVLGYPLPRFHRYSGE